MAYLSNEEYRTIYNQVVRMCVDLVIKDDTGRILLTLRNIPPYKGLWHFPGGAVRFKEKIADAANRIAKKEFGVEVRLLNCLGACEIINDDLDEENPRHSNSVVYLAEIVGGKICSSEESESVAYFSKLPQDMPPYHGSFITNHQLL